jgi:hypothetical protein
MGAMVARSSSAHDLAIDAISDGDSFPGLEEDPPALVMATSWLSIWTADFTADETGEGG